MCSQDQVMLLRVIWSRAFPISPPLSTLPISQPLKRTETTNMDNHEAESVGIPKSYVWIIRGLQIVLAVVSSRAGDHRSILTVVSAL